MHPKTLPAGSDTYVQYNGAGVFAASSDFMWATYDGSGSSKKCLKLWGGGHSAKGFTFWWQDGSGGHPYCQIEWGAGAGVLSFGDGTSTGQPLLGFYCPGGSMVFGSDFGYGAYLGGTVRFTSSGIGFFDQSGGSLVIDGGNLIVSGTLAYSGPLFDSNSNQIADVTNGLITGVYY